jgi:beta-carotene hydroxylase
MLRNKADRRTLLWVFGLMPAAALLPYAFPQLAGWLLPLGLYFGFCAGVLSHNQNHCPTFRGRFANTLYGAWLSVFYGYPTFAWIPTHNSNHHRYVNGPGDDTITWRYSRRNTWTNAWTYFFISSYWQSGPIQKYISDARTKRPEVFRRIIGQYAAVLLTHAALLALAIYLHGAKLGMLVYATGFMIPALFALWSMMFINYIQHVDCDPWSENNHSRNFVSKLGNWLVFNNGLHTAHHENAGTHWSKLPEVHARLAPNIDPELCQQSIFGFCFRTYVLGLFIPRFRTNQIGRAAYDTSSARAPMPQTGDEESAIAG